MGIESIGIDFGTTNTCVAVKEGGRARVLAIDETAVEPKLFRTLLYIPSRKECFFGNGAIEQYFDRGMEGRFFQSIKKLLPNSEFSGTSVFGLHMGVETLIARFLAELKKRIEKQIGSIEGIPVAMGRPARYSLQSDKENLAVKRFCAAIELGGFQKTTLVDEPVAAAFSSPINTSSMRKTVLVCDLGGGTSDFTIFRRGGREPIETLAVYGVPVAGDSLDSDFFRDKLNVFFGSEIKYQRPFSSNVLTLPLSFTKILPKWHHHAFLKERSTWNFILDLRKELVDERQKPLLENLITLVDENLGYKLHQSVEHLKVELSAQSEDDFSFQSYPIKINFRNSAVQYEETITPSVNDITEAARETVRLANFKPEQIEALQFTGGTAKVPKIRRELAALFPRAEIVESEAFTAVAEGLALYK